MNTTIGHKLPIRGKSIIHVLLLLSTFMCISGEVSAQRIPAWTRKLTPARWQTLTQGTSFRPSEVARFIKFPRKAVEPIKRVTTTDRNFLVHHIGFSRVFAKADKEILVRKSLPYAKLGELSYLHDKHAAFFTTLVSRDESVISQPAFLKHQETLQAVLTGLEAFYRANVPEELLKRFSSDVFSEQEVARLISSANQPPAFLLSSSELAYFAQLPTLAEQKAWVADRIAAIQQHTLDLLAQDTYTLPRFEFERYYIQNMRLAYFQTLAQALEQAHTKRNSAIVRYRLALWEGSPSLTDAHRAGYLQFLYDTTSNAALEADITHLNENYGPYATAEAFGVPYEVTLTQNNMYAPELLGKAEGQRLRTLPNSTCLVELPSKIQALENQLEDLRKDPVATREFYLHYYRLHVTQQIYRARLARARALQEWENMRR